MRFDASEDYDSITNKIMSEIEKLKNEPSPLIDEGLGDNYFDGKRRGWVKDINR